MTCVLKLTSRMSAQEMEPHWPKVFEQLEDYVAQYPSHTTLEMLMRDLANGKLQLWIVIDKSSDECIMSVVTEIVTLEATGDGAVSVFALSGERLKELAPMIDDIIAWAQKNFNVTEAEITGRPGICKVLKPCGFEQQAVIMKRSLTDGQEVHADHQ